MNGSTTDATTRQQADTASSYDLAFAGAGASTAYVLLALLAGLPTEVPSVPLRIAVVEPAPDPFSGIAYGGRAARTSLLITPLRDFLPDDERALFATWLTENKDWVFEEFLACAGPLADQWWARHRDEISRDEFESLYLPRYVFGVYLMRRTRAAIEAAARAGVAEVEVVRDRVVTVEPSGGDYVLACEQVRLASRHLVLATGSAPVRPRLPMEVAARPAVLIDDPFGDMEGAREQIGAALRRVSDRRTPHVVFVGANAGTMDMLFHVNDLRGPAVRQTRFTVMSPRGELPERIDDRRPARPFTAERLLELGEAPEVSAAELYKAALADIDLGRSAGLTVRDTLPPISAALGSVVRRLPPGEAVEFAGHWGVELGRHQRRAGWEYCDAVDDLTAEGRLRLVAGSFVDAVPGDGTVTVRYRVDDGTVLELEQPADVVVNCGGPGKLLTDAEGSLAAQLIRHGVCEPTPFGGGIAVDGSLAAAPRLFVMGPLLAGNVVRGGPVWHMEHCGRISAFGWALGSELSGVLSTRRG